MLDADGNQERAGGVLDLVHNFTALNFTALSTGGYATDIPESFTSVSTGNTGSTDTKFHNYLWLLEKTTTASTGSSLTNSRNVAIYKLLTVTEVTVDTAVKYALTFQRLS